MSRPRAGRIDVARWLREPLLQFLLMGLLLFLGYRALHPAVALREQPARIEITGDDLRQLQIGWQAQGRPVPTQDELRLLVESRIREEILYREALALGLDQGDTIVKRRLAQKMEFLFEDVATLREPSTDELRAWYEKNGERFTQPARATFRHLYFSPDRRSSQARADAARVLSKAAGKPLDWPGGATLADPFMFQDYYGDASFDDVAKAFGPGFARALFQLTPGAWSGPIESGYGWHLVWVDSITPARVPALEVVEAEVRLAWTEEQRSQIREKAYAAMKARYEVVVPSDLSIVAAASPAQGVAPQVEGVVPE